MDTMNKSILAPQFQSSREKGDVEGPCRARTAEEAAVKVEPCMDEPEKAPKLHENIDVDIMNGTNKGDFASTDIEDPDATEYSSSFGDTSSNTETCTRLGEVEVDSEFSGGITCTFDAFSSVLKTRKKKLTNHWRTFIHPLTWRCKWAELRIKEIDSQTMKYAKELAEYDRWKHLGVDHCTIKKCGSKSWSLSRNRCRNKALKRRKRKKVEDTTETTSYTSSHILFSYLENKKSDPEATSLVDDFRNPDVYSDPNDRLGITGYQLMFELREGESSLEMLLWMMETTQSRINKLKGQIEVIMSRNCSRFSSSGNLSLLVPCDVQTSSVHSPAFSTGIEDTVSVGAIHNHTHHLPEYETGESFLLGSNVSSYGEAITIPDIVESTVGLLSAANISLRRSQTGDSYEDVVDNILIDNEMAESEGNTLKTVDLPANQEGKEEKDAVSSSLGLSASDPVAKSGVTQEQSIMKSSLCTDVQFPKAKRKRAERKPGSGSWSRKCSGDPSSR